MATELMTPAEAAELIRVELGRGDRDFALRILVSAVDDWREAVARARVDGGDVPPARYLAAPSTTGSDRWDALLAGAIGRRCRLLSVPTPGWVDPAPLRSWWFVDDEPLLFARTMARTAPDLARLGIWLDEAAFATV